MEILTIKIENGTITEVDEAKFLGLVIDSHLNLKSHINHICPKISKNIGTINRIRL